MVAQARSDPTKQQKDAYNIFSSMASKPIDICWIETGSQSELLVLLARALGHTGLTKPVLILDIMMR